MDGVPPAAGVLHGVHCRRGAVGSRRRRGGEQAEAVASGCHGQWDRRKVIFLPFLAFFLYSVLFILLLSLINELKLNSPNQFSTRIIDITIVFWLQTSAKLILPFFVSYAND